jgi:hypothetical protein
MGVGAAVVCADWLVLDSMWVAPTYVFLLKVLVDLLCQEKLQIIFNGSYY